MKYVIKKKKMKEIRNILKKRHVNGSIYLKCFEDADNNYILKEFRLSVKNKDVINIKTEANEDEYPEIIEYSADFITEKKAHESYKIKEKLDDSRELITELNNKIIFVDDIPYDDIVIVNYRQVIINENEKIMLEGETDDVKVFFENLTKIKKKIEKGEWIEYNFITLVDGIQDRFTSSAIETLIEIILKNIDNISMIPVVFHEEFLKTMFILMSLKLNYIHNNKDKIIFGVNDCIRFI